jgi:hypothetical protein
MTNRLRGVAWTGIQFVAVGDAGIILTSPDGTTWTPQTSGTTSDLYAAAADTNIIVVVGGGIFTSPTGTTWTPRTSAGGTPVRGVIWSGTQFLAVGPYPNAQTSFDGITWASRTPPFANAMFAAAWSGSEFIAVGQSGFTQHSADGISWSSENTGLVGTFELDGVTWNGSRFIAVGSSGTIITTQ